MEQVPNAAGYAGCGAAFAAAVGGKPSIGGALGLAGYGLVTYLRTPPRHGLPAGTGGGVVITGTSTGIGFAAAKELAELGYMVFAGVRKEKDGSALAKVGCIPIILEVTNEESVLQAAIQVRSKLAAAGKPLVALINNAGVSGAGLPIELETEQNLDWVDSVNVRGVIRMTRCFVPLLREGNDLGNSGGRIINIGSVMGHLALENQLSYTMSKHAVEAITKVMREEFGRFGIAVSVVNPGYVRTEIMNNSADSKRKEIEALRAKYGKDMHSLYPDVFDADKAQDFANKVKEVFTVCPPPSASTTPAIVHALTSTRPKPEYIVGNLAPDKSYPSASWGLYLLWLLPTSTLMPSTHQIKPKHQ